MKRTALGLVLIAALAGCGGGDGGGDALDSTESVCDDFAAHSKAGLPAADRAEVTRSIGEVIGNADQRLQDAHEALVRTASGTDGAYKIAADTFANACFNSGWDG